MVPTELYQGQPASTETTMYTVPAGQRLIGTEIILCNTTSIVRTITLHWRRGGVAAGVANRILSGREVGANSSIIISLGSTMLGAGGIISGLASVSGTITVTISGILEAI